AKLAKITSDPVSQDKGSKTQEPSAPVFTRKLRKAAVGAGCDIRLRVSVSGHPKPVLTWYHNDELLPPSEAQESGGLWIRDCRTTDAGLYTCLATNELGKASCSAVLGWRGERADPQILRSRQQGLLLAVLFSLRICRI
uniref:Ig-like domain-containing protein n=1 Tax=Oryzias latipes TaxID=8090 RepID=A0A3P9MR32_ORYLA